MLKLKHLFPLLLCVLWAQGAVAQPPKWVEKAKQAVFSVITYDAANKIVNTGNGFFVGEDGVALSDYTLFKGAQRAVIVDSEGAQMPITAIMGVDDMYDVIKFKVGITHKKVHALKVAQSVPATGAEVYLLPYSTRKNRLCTAGRLQGMDKVGGNYNYYTLKLRLEDKMVSCPVMTADGQVLGIVQKSSGRDTASICYAVDARFALSQQITALSFNDEALRSIGIKKALPDDEDQALVLLFMLSSQVTPHVYAELLDDFVAKFPGSADGYSRRASHRLSVAKTDADMDGVVADMEKSLEVSGQKDDAHYTYAKMIYSYALSAPETPYKDWTYDKALAEVDQAIALSDLPVYQQLRGDILFAKQDYAGAAAAYDKVNATNLASPSTFFSAARTRELLQAPSSEILALADSCVSRLPQPYTEAAAPYLLWRAQLRVANGQARNAMLDYDAYYQTVKGQVNDVFYSLREQAAMQAKQYQRALDDIAKAIELNPDEPTYRAEQGVINIRIGRYEEALKILVEAISKFSDYAELYRLKGLAHVQLKQLDEACANFSKAKELGSEAADAMLQKYCK